MEEKLFELACCGNIDKLSEYVSGGGDLNVRYPKFGRDNSLIMGAFRNQEYETAVWLSKHGCKLTDDEQREIDMERRKMACIELLSSCKGI